MFEQYLYELARNAVDSCSIRNRDDKSGCSKRTGLLYLSRRKCFKKFDTKSYDTGKCIAKGESNMKIGIVNEVSAYAKNKDIVKALEAYENVEILNMGMHEPTEENPLTYIQTGIMSAILLNCGICDFVVGGCGTGQGYPLECAQSQQHSKAMLEKLSGQTHKTLAQALRDLDEEVLAPICKRADFIALLEENAEKNKFVREICEILK